MNAHVAPNFDDMRHEAAGSFLHGLFEPTDTVCLWLIHQTTKQQKQFIQPLDQIADPVTFAQLDKMQNDGWNVYVCMNPLKAGSKRRIKENVAEIRTAYLDLDIDGPERLAQLKAAVKAGEIPAPRFVVMSSPDKYHGSWRVNGLTQGQQEQLNKRLAAQFGGDSASTDCVRVLRIPGFNNLKYAEQPLVMLLERRTGQATLDQFKIAGTPTAQTPATPFVVKETSTTADEKVMQGSRNTRLASLGESLRHDGLDGEEILAALLSWNSKHCVPPLPDDEVATIADSMARYPVGKDESCTFGGVPAGTNPVASGPPVFMATETTETEADADVDDDAIPDFDTSVVNGIYARFVDVVTRGTTLAPQFTYAIAKVIVGARMAGNVKFDILDAEPRFYLAMIGETGSGKGYSWQRTYQQVLRGNSLSNCRLKIINSADSGAGLCDVFFETDQPVLCYVDEITSLGNKAAPTHNPAILDMMIELANSTSISRVLAKKKGNGTGDGSKSKSKDDARFSLIACGQTGSVYAKAFAGRGGLGLWDRITPEFGVPVEPGDTRDIDPIAAVELLAELNALDYSGTMVMSAEAKTRLDEFWRSQPGDIRKKVRFKNHLLMDAYLSAFGRGLKTVELGDADIAVKIFVRQMVIRRVHFGTEVPDRVGFYLGQIKKITERMKRQLASGKSPEAVARSRRDYERATSASRDNEEHVFSKSWETHSRVHLVKVIIERANGQRYEKYLPLPEDPDENPLAVN